MSQWALGQNQRTANRLRQPSTILRLTAEHSPGGAYPANVAAYISGVFRGTIAATDHIPAGLHLYPALAGASITIGDIHPPARDGAAATPCHAAPGMFSASRWHRSRRSVWA
jgi:hypothetical protein